MTVPAPVSYTHLERVLWGVGVDSSIVRASLKAIVSAVNRALRPAEVRG